MKLAYYSPLPPETSGVADYSALLLPALERRVQLEVVAKGKKPPRDADLALYHVGNDPDAHGWIVDALRKRPGLVVLHELVLHHLIAGITIGRRDGRGYLDAMERDFGLAGRLLAHGVLENRVPYLWEVRPQDFPLCGEVLDLAQAGLIVHSRYMEEKVRERGYRGRVWRIPHPAWPGHIPAASGSLPGVDPAASGDPLVGCFGHINASKRVPQLVRAFVALLERHPGAKLLLVGSAAPGFELALGDVPEGAIIREEYVPEDRMWSLMHRCDVLVNLRHPTMGETSGSVIRALSLGKPVVVSDVGWFAELPDEAAFKVPADEREQEALTATLEALADPELRARAGAAARAYVEAEHELDKVAERYAAAIEQAAGGEAVQDAVATEIASAAAEVGIAAGSPEAAELARALRDAGLGS
jgi:glycosyltransferase involved in cell wall biosynthesis